jgi:hypothetical protein
MSNKVAAAVCAAVLSAGGTWECERCALAWDDGDKAPACSTVTYSRLRAVAEEEAERIRQSQDAILEARPQQRFRNQEQLTKRMAFLALVRLIDKIKAADVKGKAA